eukprot:g24282.t1
MSQDPIGQCPTWEEVRVSAAQGELDGKTTAEVTGEKEQIARIPGTMSEDTARFSRECQSHSDCRTGTVLPKGREPRVSKRTFQTEDATL